MPALGWSFSGLELIAEPGLLDATLGEVLLTPTRIYARDLLWLRAELATEGHEVHGMAHITGGGITDNLPRILPKDTHALIRVGSWTLPDLFLFLQETGEVETEEMFRVFNMGIGMILAVDPAGLAEVLGLLRSAGQKSFVVGTVQPGGSGVAYDFSAAEGIPEA